MYEIIEHTADIGLRIRAATLNQLFVEAARALMGLLLEDLHQVKPVERHSIQLEGKDRANLLVDWLSELLYLYSTRRLILIQFDVQVTDNGLVAEARGEKPDPARHTPDLDIKAVTYHGLKLKQDDQGWMAEVILDI